MEITKTLIIQILSKEEFEKLLLEHLCELHQDNSLEDLMKELLEKGFNKLDWNDLNQTLKDLFIYLPTVAVKIDEKFSVANIVGGTIVIPHTRRAAEYWEELGNNEQGTRKEEF